MSEDDIKEISTGIILLKEDDKGNRKILLIERFERGTFEIPKGHVEDYDKTVKMAAERELREVSLFCEYFSHVFAQSIETIILKTPGNRIDE